MVKASGMFKNVPTAIVGVLPDTTDSSALGHKLDKPPKETFEVSSGCTKNGLKINLGKKLLSGYRWPGESYPGNEGVRRAATNTSRILRGNGHHCSEGSHSLRRTWHRYERLFWNEPWIIIGFPGKTLLAKAVANSTAATFIRATGADLVQKNSGDGAKLVR